MKNFPFSAALALTLCLPGLAHAATLNVPGQYASIQAAVNASANGDTVLLADGTYSGPGNVDVDFNGKNITVTSQNGADNTIIDCGGSTSANHRGFYLHSGETSAAISGLTVENGYTARGSAADSGYGGGICAVSAGLTVTRCVVTNNTSGSGNGGGGIYTSNTGSAIITILSCTIANNTAQFMGGGIENDNDGKGTTTVQNCTISGNTSQDNAAGIYNSIGAHCSGAIILENSKIVGNTADYSGGGVVNSNNGPYNSAGGGAITLVNCVVIGSTAQQGVGGIQNGNSGSDTIAVTNCTVTGNFGGGGVSSSNGYGGGTTILTNDIVYGNAGSEVILSGDTGMNTGPSKNVVNCDVKGGYYGVGDINADPKFVSATDFHPSARLALRRRGDRERRTGSRL